MIHSLRKRHRWMWLALSILLPIGFIAAVLAVPETVVEKDFQVRQPVLYSTIVSTTKEDGFQVHLRKDDNLPGRQIEVLVEKPFNIPNSFVYIANQKTGKFQDAGLLGKLEGIGSYRFNLGNFVNPQNPEIHLLFYDQIKKEAFKQITVSTK